MNFNIYLVVVLDLHFKLHYIKFVMMDMYEGIDKVTLTQLIRFSYYVIFHDYKIKAIGGS